MEKFSLTDIKKMNYSDVYHYIYHNARSSKQSIASALRMSLPTVTQHLNALLGEGLIEQCGQLSSQIGRKAAAYNIIKTAKIALGVEILRSKLQIVALDLSGEVIAKKKQSLNFTNSELYFQQFGTEINNFLEEFLLDKKQILGIGLGLQGLISQDGTKVIYGKVLECTGLTIQSFKQYLDYPCRLVHDSECAAMSELWGAEAIADSIFLSLGYHLGGAIIVNGAIHNGKTGRSGTFEHMTLIPDGLPCYCGQKGCMECYCSANALLKGEEDLDSFFERKNAGDSDIQKRFHTFLEYLALAINNLHMTFDSQIILGGHIAPYLEEQDLEFLHRHIQSITAFPESDPYIFQGKCKSHVVSIGAGLPYIQSYLGQI